MYKKMFTTKAEKTVESVKDAFLRETGDSDWGYDTMEEIERSECEGFLEFKDGNLTVYMNI